MVTIRDVAERAGVNPSTVSRALKDSPSISQKTKDLVRKAMDELGYVPNAAAKILASGLTHSIGLIFPPMTRREMRSQPFYMEILTAINGAASQQGYTVTVITGDGTPELKERVHQMYLERRVDGFILLYSVKDDPVQAYLLDEKIPFVMVGTPIQYENETTFVDNDNTLMGRTAVEHLYDRGHRRILFVTDNLDGEVQLERLRGYEIGMKQLGLTAYPVQFFVQTAPETYPDLIGKIQAENITALVVIDDMLSLRLMQFLSFSRLPVPDQVSIVSFNNSVYAEIIHPYLTTFDINITSLGRLSFSRIFEKLQAAEDGNTKMLVPFSLEERESVRTLEGEKSGPGSAD